MELAKINNYIKLVKEYKIDELMKTLEYDRQQAIMEEKGQKMKLAPAIKKVLSDKDIASRPVLQSIQHDSNGKQFICDGFLLIRWNNEQEELNGFPQTPTDKSIKADAIIPKVYETQQIELSENDRLIISNINKYVKINKDFGFVYVFDKYFSAKLLKKVIDVVGADFNKYYIQDKEPYRPICLFEDEFDGLVMPCRANEELESDTIKRTNEFLEMLRGE